MIGHQHEGARVIDCFEVLKTINSHQVISRDVNPAGAKEALTPGPETFPGPAVHAMRDVKGKALEGREDREFLRRRLKREVRELIGNHRTRVIE